MTSYDDETVRQWAYDKDRDFIDDSMQDEDLVLGGLSPDLLLPLIDDPDCPKSEYLLACLDFDLMFDLLWGRTEKTQKVQGLARQCKRAVVLNWADLLTRRLRYRKGIGLVNRELALNMGHDLMNGLARFSDISILEETADQWTVELSVPPFHSHKEWLKISKTTGKFEFNR